MLGESTIQKLGDNWQLTFRASSVDPGPFRPRQNICSITAPDKVIVALVQEMARGRAHPDPMTNTLAWLQVAIQDPETTTNVDDKLLSMSIDAWKESELFQEDAF